MQSIGEILGRDRVCVSGSAVRGRLVGTVSPDVFLSRRNRILTGDFECYGLWVVKRKAASRRAMAQLRIYIYTHTHTLSPKPYTPSHVSPKLSNPTPPNLGP